jgi:hypothetical protein
MKKMFLLAVMVVAVLAAFGPPVAKAAEYGPLFSDEAAQLGANFFVRYTHDDLTTTNVNTAQTLSVPVATQTAWQLVAMVLETPFDTGNTNYTGSTLLKIGDGSDDDLFLTSTELASDGSEVYLKFGAPNSATAATTLIYPTGTTNAGPALVTGVTVGELGRKVYTATGNIVSTFTPNSDEAVSALTSGAVRVYFRQWSR